MCHITGLNISDWNDTVLSDDFYYTVNTRKKSLFSEEKKKSDKKEQIFVWTCNDFYIKFLGKRYWSL